MIMKIEGSMSLNARVGRPISGHLDLLSTETIFSSMVFPEVVARKSLCGLFLNTSNNFKTLPFIVLCAFKGRKTKNRGWLLKRGSIIPLPYDNSFQTFEALSYF